MFTISVQTHFWASHCLTSPDGSKESQHWHNFLITAELTSDTLNSTGLVMDFCQLKTLLEKITAPFDSTPLDKIDYFRQNNASAEKMAEYIYENLEPKLPKTVKLHSITVTEEPGYSAKFGK